MVIRACRAAVDPSQGMVYTSGREQVWTQREETDMDNIWTSSGALARAYREHMNEAAAYRWAWELMMHGEDMSPGEEFVEVNRTIDRAWDYLRDDSEGGGEAEN